MLLKRLKLPRMYKHRWALARILNTDFSPPSISDALEARLVQIFTSVQRLYRQAMIHNENRHSFFSYSLFLRETLLFLGESELAQLFEELKSPDKTQQQRYCINKLLSCVPKVTLAG